MKVDSIQFTVFICFLLSQLLFPKGLEAQIIPAPVITCVTTDEASGDVTVIWDTSLVLDPCGSFSSFVLYGGTSLSGPFLPIATITDSSQNTHVHTGANGTILEWYYVITMVQNCPGSTQTYSDTVKEETLFIPELDYV